MRSRSVHERRDGEGAAPASTSGVGARLVAGSRRGSATLTDGPVFGALRGDDVAHLVHEPVLRRRARARQEPDGRPDRPKSVPARQAWRGRRHPAERRLVAAGYVPRPGSTTCRRCAAGAGAVVGRDCDPVADAEPERVASASRARFTGMRGATATRPAAPCRPVSIPSAGTDPPGSRMSDNAIIDDRRRSSTCREVGRGRGVASAPTTLSCTSQFHPKSRGVRRGAGCRGDPERR